MDSGADSAAASQDAGDDTRPLTSAAPSLKEKVKRRSRLKRRAAVGKRPISRVNLKLAHLRLGGRSAAQVAETIQHTSGLAVTDLDAAKAGPLSIMSLAGHQRARPTNRRARDKSVSIVRNLAQYRYETLHIDLHGPYNQGIDGSRYFLAMTTSTGVTAVCMLKRVRASDIITALERSFVQLGTPEVIQSDFSQTLKSHNPDVFTACERFAAQSSIGWKISAPSKQWQNGRAEKYGQELYNSATALLFHAGLTLKYWPYAVRHAALLRNYTSLGSLGMTPFENHYGSPPYIGDLRVWGCPCFALRPKSQRGDGPVFVSHTQPAIYLGPAPDSSVNTFLLWNIKTKSLFASADVVFDEAFEFVDKTPKGWVVKDDVLASKRADDLLIVDTAKLHAAKLDYLVEVIRSVASGSCWPRQQSVRLEDLCCDDAWKLDAPELPGSESAQPQADPQPRSDDDASDSDSTASTVTSQVQFTTDPLQGDYSDANLQAHRHVRIAFDKSHSKRGNSGHRYGVYKHATTVGEFLDCPHTRGDFEFDLRRNLVQFVSSARPACMAAPDVSTDGGASSTDGGAEPSSALRDFLEGTDHLDDRAVAAARAATPISTARLSGLAARLDRTVRRWAGRFGCNASRSSHSEDVDDAPPPHWDGALRDAEARANTTQSTAAHVPAYSGKLRVDWNRVPAKARRFARIHGRAATIAAYEKELAGIVDAGVISEPVDLPPGYRALPLMTLFSEKADGRLKARMVVDGSRQRKGLEYDESGLYAAVMDRTSHRVLLAIGAAYKAHVHSVDVTQAFLYGDISEEIYVKPPPGVTHGGRPGQVWRLRKSLYGTKQAPAIWQAHLTRTMAGLGLQPTKADPCVFVKRSGSKFLFVGVHVDDLIIVCNDDEMLASFKDGVKTKYKLTDQGPLNNTEYLGMKTTYSRQDGVIHVSNDRMVQKLLKKSGFAESKSKVVSPAVVSAERDNAPADDGFNLWSFIGSLNYIASTTRPDIALATSKLSSVPDKKNPTVQDISDAARVAHYLAGAGTDVGLHFDRRLFSTTAEAITPVCYVDSDHCKTGDFKSRTGAVIYMCGAPIFWKSQLQKTIATSSTHAEIIALSDTAKRLVWLRTLLGEMGFRDLPPFPIYEDNQATLDLSRGKATSNRTRHIPVRYWWTRELRDLGIVDFQKVHTLENDADFFTKILTVKDQVKVITKMVSPSEEPSRKFANMAFPFPDIFIDITRYFNASTSRATSPTSYASATMC